MTTLEEDRQTLRCLELQEKARSLIAKFNFSESAKILEEALQFSQFGTQKLKSSIYTSLAESLFKSGQAHKAIQTLEIAINTFTDEHINNQIKWRLAALQINSGDYLVGHRLMESIKQGHYKLFQTHSNFWNGVDDLAGKNILLMYEDCGIGDAIAFLRFAKLLADRGAIPTVEVATPLNNIEIEGVHVVERQGDQLAFINQFDYIAYQFSMPFLLQMERHAVPSDPYIKVSQHYSSKWAKSLGSSDRFRVGICWSSVSINGDKERFMRLNQLDELLNLDVEFHSLQIQYVKCDKAIINQTMIIDHSNEIKCMHDTAGLIGQMDLIISVDTAVAHLSGAIGKPLWILLPKHTVQYWDIGRSYWYRNAKLFRQPSEGDWDSVINVVKNHLMAINGRVALNS